MKRTIFLSVATTVAALVIGPSLATALTAMTTEPTNLRAGPAFDFPVVDRIPDDATVTVHGCVRAYRWCDISWRDARGWVSGNELAYFYQQRYVPVVEYGPRIGLPIVVFSFDSYWDRYYRGRPFYGERTRWRTVWRDRDGGGRRNAERPSERREGKADNQSIDRREGKAQSNRQTDGRKDANVRQRESGERRMNSPANEERPGRADRGESRERSGSRALSPGDNRGNDRGAGGRGEGARERSGGPQGGGRDGGGGQGDRRSN